MRYIDFLQQKLVSYAPNGLDCKVNSGLFDWQKAATEWALKTGRAALFEDCGLGKTAQQLVWAKEVSQYTKKPTIILAPLAVSAQTQREGLKFDCPVNICHSQADVKQGINITNYEKLEHFEPSAFGAVVLDESSILKAYMGKTKRRIVEAFSNTPFKLACTATPAPNDLMELLNHAEFLEVMKSSEALSIWFIADQKNSGTYVLKGHATADFWRWVASWAVCIESPADIGYSDEGYKLPPLNELNDIVDVSLLADDYTVSGFIRDVDISATGFFKEKSRTVKERASKCAEIVSINDQQYLLWCYTNEEADELKRLLPNAVEVRGNDKAEKKEQAALDFVDGKTRVLISKPSIFGYGLNFQNCNNAVFCGLDYSFEMYYQAVRRLYRFGQKQEVNIHRVLGSTEKTILDVIERKARQKNEMAKGMASYMRELQTSNLRGSYYKLDFLKQTVEFPDWLRSEIC